MAPLNVLFFSYKDYDVQSFNTHNKGEAKLTYVKESLSEESFNQHKAGGVDAICVFVNDEVPAKMLDFLKAEGVKAVFNRCAGFDRVDVKHAEKIGMQIARVPAYSPYAVAEQAVSLLCTLNRKLHLANNRTCVGNFSIDGLVGMDIFGKTVGVVGTGRIGQIFIDIMTGFGCNIVAFDIYQNEGLKARPNFKYVELDEVWKQADIISLHVNLTPKTKHMICAASLNKMKDGVIILNCGRGGLINTKDTLAAIATGRVRGLGIDVYENEAGVFFNDCTNNPAIQKDKDLMALMASPNVLISAHQAFLTEEALTAIATTTLLNIREVSEGKKGKELTNWVPGEMAN